MVLALLNDVVNISDLPNGFIKQDRFVVIADAHLGSLYEKMAYLDYVYNFAVDNNIYDVLHASDLIQSTISPVLDRYESNQEQLDHLVKDYPKVGNICTHILFDNHDFNLLGFKRAYLSWQKYLIVVVHDIKNYKINIPDVEGLLRFVGHRHSFLFTEPSNVYVPTLSLKQKKYVDDIYSYPGYLVCEMNEKNVSIAYYAFKDYIVNHYDKKEIIKMSERNFDIEL